MNEKGLKSSFDLAMERMAARDGGLVNLTAEQKKAIGDLAQRTKAKIAEIEILFAQTLAKARANPDAAKAAEEASKVEGERDQAIGKLRDAEERDKDRIRHGA